MERSEFTSGVLMEIGTRGAVKTSFLRPLPGIGVEVPDGPVAATSVQYNNLLGKLRVWQISSNICMFLLTS